LLRCARTDASLIPSLEPRADHFDLSLGQIPRAQYVTEDALGAIGRLDHLPPVTRSDADRERELGDADDRGTVPPRPRSDVLTHECLDLASHDRLGHRQLTGGELDGGETERGATALVMELASLELPDRQAEVVRRFVEPSLRIEHDASSRETERHVLGGAVHGIRRSHG